MMATGEARVVLRDGETYRVVQGDCLEVMRAMPESSVDLVFGSPPYMDARTYGIDAARGCQEWVDWMLDVTEAAVRVSKGLVLWVVAGVQRDLCYWPGCEGLAWEWWKRGHHLWRPCIWWKVDEDDGGNGIPGSGGKQWLRNDWEYVLAFKKEGWLPFADNTAMGHEPVLDQVGGRMSNRTTDGRRINEAAHAKEKRRWSDEEYEPYDPWGKRGSGNSLGGRRKNGNKMVGSNRRQNGKRKRSERDRKMDVTSGHDKDGNTGRADGRPMPNIANPGNCIIVKARVGGGHMGSRLCHDNEAPFPEDLAKFFVEAFCPPGGVVLDPFSGSGTTAAVAVRHSRRAIGIDIRESMCAIARERIAGETPLALFEETSCTSQD